MRHERNFDSIRQAFDAHQQDQLDNATPESGSIVQQFLVGAIAGAAVALLFAPQAGRDSRTWLKDNSSRLRDGAGDRLGFVKDALHDGAEVVRESVSAGREAYHSARAETAALSTYGG